MRVAVPVGRRQASSNRTQLRARQARPWRLAPLATAAGAPLVLLADQRHLREGISDHA